MARLRRRGGGEELNPWPGYVDALSTLLMVIIFVLLVFVLAQAFLSVALTGRNRALDRLNQQMAELTDMLNLERGRSGELQNSVAQLTRDLQSANTARDGLSRQLAQLRDDQGRLQADRDTLRTDRDRIAAQLSDAQTQVQAASGRSATLQAQITAAARTSDSAGQETAAVASQLADSRRQLAANQAQATGRERQLADTQAQLAAAQAQLAQLRAQLVELDKTVTADKATIEARLSDLARLADQVRQLTALRDQLERQAGDAAARATTDAQRAAAVAAQLADTQKFSDTARAQIALLNRTVDELRAQLQQVSAALDISEKSGRDKDAQVANLGQRLNTALAAKVEELQRYRSEFFGKLRDVLQNRPGIQVVGDRFVFQSEVLFPVGSADLTSAGQDQIRALAGTLKDIAKDIPSDVNWLLRVDGHADRQPLGRGQFASNWELSAQRAINVVKLLVSEGVPPARLAATGFGEYQPLDNSDAPDSYARNRRIELRLTDR